jgi:DNA-binding MarR family transcriptional regulator
MKLETQKLNVIRKFESSAYQRISVKQALSLFYLDEDDITTSSLAKRVGVTSAAATGMVDRMVDRGLVVRTRNRSDRRVITVQITDRGRGVVSRIINS